MFRRLLHALVDWLIADDPNPEYSALDRLDGLGNPARIQSQPLAQFRAAS